MCIANRAWAERRRPFAPKAGHETAHGNYGAWSERAGDSFPAFGVAKLALSIATMPVSSLSELGRSRRRATPSVSNFSVPRRQGKADERQ